eukprot:scpid49220/ scgid25729/ Ubiquitin carboxyl-terminal hydrolase 10; Deubiquitinating enzyme 10; Ubiquitin thioesterase 10; Ubiquitin-specific-processing protease 10
MASNPRCSRPMFGDFSVEESQRLFGSRPETVTFPRSFAKDSSSAELASQLSDASLSRSDTAVQIEEKAHGNGNAVESHKAGPTSTGTVKVAERQKIDVATVSSNNASTAGNPEPASATTPEDKKAGTPPKAAWGQKKSFASLFKEHESNGIVIKLPSKPPSFNGATTHHQPTPAEHHKRPAKLPERVSVSDDSVVPSLIEFFSGRELRKHSKVLELRGLINRGNKCYMASVLQALLNCTPLSNLLHDLADVLAVHTRPRSSTPVLDAMAAFVKQFESVATPPGTPGARRPSAGKSSVDGFSVVERKGGRKKSAAPEIAIGKPFEPTGIYSIVAQINSQLVEGMQEDAEEFLSALLNRLHEEIGSVLQFNSSGSNTPAHGAAAAAAATAAASQARETKAQVAATMMMASRQPQQQQTASEDASEWEQVSGGRKNKSAVTRAMTLSSSPVSAMFCGEMRSAVSCPGAKHSATLQPFMCLPLDIHGDEVRTVQDALHLFGRKEKLEGYLSKDTRKEVDAVRRSTLSRVPPVLILHLKRFMYNAEGGSQKLHKFVKFGFKLTLGKELLAPTVQSCSVATMQYSLIAVINHHGKTAQNGHYSTDVRHKRSASWVRCDDSVVKPISDGQVMNYPTNKTPYILFFTRDAVPSQA